MWLFQFEMSPKPGTSHTKKCVGAFGYVWIDFPYRDLSEVVARHCLRDDGWRIRKLRYVVATNRAKMRKIPENLKFYEEAKRDGISILVHGYRNGKEKKSRQ